MIAHPRHSISPVLSLSLPSRLPPRCFLPPAPSPPLPPAIALLRLAFRTLSLHWYTPSPPLSLPSFLSPLAFFLFRSSLITLAFIVPLRSVSCIAFGAGVFLHNSVPSPGRCSD